MARIEELKEKSILDVAQSLGMEMKRKSATSYYWRDHDSFVIDTGKNIWSWFSQEKSGDVFDLVQEIKGVSFKGAKHYLETGDFSSVEVIQEIDEPFKNYLEPYESKDFREARAYLRDIRGLSDETIDFALDQGNITQARLKRENHFEDVIVFKSKGSDGVDVGASLQGIEENRQLYPERGRLKQIMKHSDGLSGYTLDVGHPKRLVFLEAPIDLLSYYEINREHLSDVKLVAMEGLKKGVISHYVVDLLTDNNYSKEHQKSEIRKALDNLKKTTNLLSDRADLITLAVDNDKAGLDFIKKLKDEGFNIQEDLPPIRIQDQTKMDWNDYLKLRKDKKGGEGKMTLDNNDRPIKKDASDLSQEASRNMGEFHRTSDYLEEESSRAASQPVVVKQPDFPSIAPLNFTITGDKVSNRKPDYHFITDKELRRLNRFAPTLQSTAQWYLNEIADSKISYFFLNQKGENEVITLNFTKKNFAHLTGISPVGRTMEEALEDFALGKGDYTNILLSNASRDKMKVLPLLPEIVEAGSFIFNDISSISKLHNIDMSKAITPEDSDLLVLFKNTTDDGLIPASLMRIKGRLSLQLDNLDKQVVLGVYRERQGIIDQLSINDEYIKDGGKELKEVLEKEITEERISLREGVRMSEIQEKMGNLMEENSSQLYLKSLPDASDYYLDIAKEEADKIVTLLHHPVLKGSNEVISWLVSWSIDSTELDYFIKKFEHEQNLPISLSQAQYGLTEVRDELSKKHDVSLKESVKNHLSLQKEETKTVSKMIADKDTKALSQHMKEGIKTYLQSDQYKKFLKAMSHLNQYSARNIQFLLAQNPEVKLVNSYRNWQNDFERQVTKGEKALKIWAPTSVIEKDKKTGKPLRDEKGNVVKRTYFVLVPVFDVSQTKGKEIPKSINELEGKHEDYANLYSAAKVVSEAQHVSFEISKSLDEETKGYYSPSQHKIVIRGGMSEQQTLKTIFHEMAHSDLHTQEKLSKKSLKYSTMELQAESVAYVVANHYGLDTSEYSFGYLANWSEDKETLKDLEAQLSIVQKEANSLIMRIDASLEKLHEKTIVHDKFHEKMTEYKTLSQSKQEEKAKDNPVKKAQAQREQNK